MTALTLRKPDVLKARTSEVFVTRALNLLRKVTGSGDENGALMI